MLMALVLVTMQATATRQTKRTSKRRAQRTST